MPYNEALRPQKKRVLTQDGSVTLYSCEFDEAYHSDKDGALRESLHKHVIPAFTLLQGKKELKILDICFGLGYNTLATLHYVKTNDLSCKVHILSPEFDEELVRSLEDFDYPAEFETLRHIVRAISRDFYYEDERFKIEVAIGDAREVVSKRYALSFDIVYQDAFSPRKNPLLWTREWFADIAASMQPHGVLTTYSTAASTRMGLYENGFFLYNYQGEGVRKSLIALKTARVEKILEPIDMAHKIAANPHARSLRDSDL